MSSPLLLTLLPLLTAVAEPAATASGDDCRKDITIEMAAGATTETIEVEAGCTVDIRVVDSADAHAYAMILPVDGRDGEAWWRDGSGSSTTLPDVVAPIRSVVVMAAKSDPKSVTYGPVITVKPKG